MEFKQLQSFVEVARLESFTKAAETLFISQPTISTHIRQLEEELRTRLIVRTTKSIAVTPKGREFYDYAVSILDLRDRMVRNCSADEKRIITIGASTIPSAYLLPEILPEYGRISPDTYFNIQQGDSRSIMSGIRDGIYDLGIVGMRPDDENFDITPLCRDRMVIITPVNEYYLNLRDKGLPIEELLREPIILREEGSGSQKRAHEYLTAHGMSDDRLNITARINDPEAIKNLVAGGLGISIMSERAADNFIRAKRLLKIELPDEGATRWIYLIHGKDYIFKPDTQDFIQFLKKYYEKENRQ